MVAKWLTPALLAHEIFSDVMAPENEIADAIEQMIRRDVAAACADKDKRIAALEAELYAIKYACMGGEDVPGSASLASVDDVDKEIERLRGIERSARSLSERIWARE